MKCTRHQQDGIHPTKALVPPLPLTLLQRVHLQPFHHREANSSMMRSYLHRQVRVGAKTTQISPPHLFTQQAHLRFIHRHSLLLSGTNPPSLPHPFQVHKGTQSPLLLQQSLKERLTRARPPSLLRSTGGLRHLLPQAHTTRPQDHKRPRTTDITSL